MTHSYDEDDPMCDSEIRSRIAQAQKLLHDLVAIIDGVVMSGADLEHEQALLAVIETMIGEKMMESARWRY